MRLIRDAIPLATAIEMVTRAAVPIECRERVDLAQAHGRVAAERIVARADVPPFDRAMMDGFAVRSEDTARAGRVAPLALRVVETIYTGHVPSRAVGSGQCARIATGAPLPAGADAVVMVEETEPAGRDVRVFAAVRPRQNVGARGADLAAGQTVIESGALLTPGRVGALAACGVRLVEVYVRPEVAIVSTGNEIVEPGRELGPGQIYDVNRYTLAALVAAHGGTAVVLPSATDTLEQLTAAVERASDAHLIVFSGGSSVGDRDLTIELLERCGEIAFHGIAVKPGKPTAFGRLRGKPVLGMPGNPTSCLSNAFLLLVPLLRRIARLPPHQPRVVSVPLARRIASPVGRQQIYTVALVNGEAVPAFKASGDITSMSQADGYIDIPAEVSGIEAGQSVTVTLF